MPFLLPGLFLGWLLTGYRVPFAVVLPADAPESSKSGDPGDCHLWDLGIRVEGMPVRSAFEFPVFRNGDEPCGQITESLAAEDIVQRFTGWKNA